MGHLKRILVATDFSEHAARAEERAAMLCEDLQLRILEVVLVEPPSVLSDVAIARNHSIVSSDSAMVRLENKMRPLCAELERNFAIRCEATVRVGRPVAEIIVRAEEVAADLLITGGHGSSHGRGGPIACHAQRLLRIMSRPLLVVFGRPATSYCHALVVVNDTNAAAHAARIAIRIAPRAHFTFLQSYEVSTWHSSSHGDYLSPDAESARKKLNRFTAELGRLPESVVRMASPGPLGIAVREYVEKYKPDLVVLANDSRDCIADLYGAIHATVGGRTRGAAPMVMDCLAA